jgi:multidrug efflux pump subunit AcrA (membrane-fusion protein)
VKSHAFVRLVAVVLSALCCNGCGGKAEAKPPPPPEVQTVAAHSGTIWPSVEIAGVIAPYRQVAVTANLSEPISEVDVVEGQHVRAGQVLARQLVDDLEAQLVSSERVVGEDEARLAQTQYQTVATTAQNLTSVASAADALRQAQVNLSGAQTDLKRYEALAAGGYIPLQTLDQQRVVVATDRQAVAAAVATLSAARINNSANGTGQNAGEQQQDLEAAKAAVDAAQATVSQLKLEMGRAVMTAPVAGIVDSVNANPGEYPSGRQLFTIEQNAQVYALLPASAAQVISIRNGAAASIETNTSYIANPQLHKDHGLVEAVLDQVQPGTTNFIVKVLVNNADSHLRAGMPVNGFVDLPAVRGIVIPVTAFVDDTRTTVLSVENDVIHLQPVGLIAEDGASAVVTGLSANTLVVKNVTNTTVGNGDRVSVNGSPSPSPTPAK